MNAVGQPIPRYEAHLKVTGGAYYTADISLPEAVHGVIIHSTIANGRTVSFDTAAAEAAPGVLAVFTYRNMPRMNATPKPWSHLHPHGQSYLPLQDNNIHYAGQPVAVVIAETLDQATHAGTLIAIGYAEHPPVVFSPAMTADAVDPPQFLWPVASSVGNAEKGIADGTVHVEQTYTTADRHHNQMEPHATTAIWSEDDTLTLYETTQHMFGARELISIVLGIPLEKINVVSHFVGGCFGGKAYVWPHTLLTALAAKAVGTARAPAAHPRPDVFDGRSSVGHGADDRNRRSPGRKTHRHSPRECVRQFRVRQLYRVCGPIDTVAMGGEQWHFHQPQDCPCKP
jgi:xanthine dehydrogenase YagR molybdenum-binding subunit